MFNKILRSTGLVLLAMATLVVFGLAAFGFVWLAVIGLFVISRFSQRLVFFRGWSWPHFLLTIGIGVGVPYALLILSAGF